LKDSFFIQHLIRKYFTNFWQKFFEETLLLNFLTQFYTTHFYIKKLNRWGKQQDRILVISNKVKRYFTQSLYIIQFTLLRK
jgi:hypothetical protein